MTLERLTNDQFVEICERWKDKTYRLFDGGWPYGVDWPTLHAVFPHTYRVGRRLVKEAKRRGLQP